MKSAFTTGHLESIITFPFQDKKWKEKFLLGSLFSFLTLVLMPTVLLPLIPAAILQGYFGRLLRGIALEGREPFLPDWNRWEQLFLDGFRLLFAGLIFAAPGILLLLLGYSAIMILPFTLSFWVSEESIAFVFLLAASQLVVMALIGLGLLWSLVVAFFYPAAATHLIVKDEFLAAFRISEWWSILRANLSGYLIAFILLIGASSIVGFILNMLYLTIILCCLIPVIISPLTFYLTVFSAGFYGQAYFEGVHPLPENSRM